MGVRRLGTLALLAAVLATATPLAADFCGGSAHCPMMRLAAPAAHAACGGGLELLPDMSCCRPAQAPATAPVDTAVAAPAPVAPLSAVVPTAAWLSIAPLRATAVAARARAERRHALGVFLLDSVFRI
jgi:hypothetical protein